MGERRGTKALELWCRRITDGYPGVSVQNMTTSWRDGLAFCAMIHHFRPDLIDFGSLNKDDIYGNNELAFRTAEQHLGIPALLDAEDMASCSVPDRLSILTYLSQFYQVFGGSSPSKLALNRTSESSGARIGSVPESPQPKVSSRLGMRREPCASCGLPVFLAEKLVVSRSVYHRSCFRCARCRHQLTPGNYYETEDGQYCCEACPIDEQPIVAQPQLTSDREPPIEQQQQQQQQQQSISSNSSSGESATPVLEAPLSDEEKSKRRSLERSVDRLLQAQRSRLDLVAGHLLDEPPAVEPAKEQPPPEDDGKFDRMIQLINERIDELTTDEQKQRELDKRESSPRPQRRDARINSAPDFAAVPGSEEANETTTTTTPTPPLRRSSSLRSSAGEHTKDRSPEPRRLSLVQRRLELPEAVAAPAPARLELSSSSPVVEDDSLTRKTREYPDHLNPFADDDDEDENVEEEQPRNKRTDKPPSTNPFGSSDEEEEPPKPQTRSKRRLLEAPQINLNPFWSDDEEPESETELRSPPVPKPRTIRHSHLEPKSNLTSSSIHSSNASIASSCSTVTPGGTYRKKKPAPPPPLLNPTPTKSPGSIPSLSPRLTPRTRKSKPAPPPPMPVAASSPIQSIDYRHSTGALTDEPVTLRHPPPDNEQRVWDEEKLSKDEANRTTQSLSYVEPNTGYHLAPDKSIDGKWKRKKGPAPARPTPLRRKIKVMSMKDVKLELDQIEMQQQGLERQGVRLEQIIRDKCKSGTPSEDTSLGLDVEELVLELFALVNEKNELFRRQAELMLLRRQQRLEEEHADIEYQVRCLITQPEATKTDFDKQREETLIQRLVEIVERRNEIVECLEMDRRREIEEDRSIHREMDLYAARNKTDNVNMTDESRRSSKLKKGKVKEKIKEKKSKKSNKKDADKDVDETEAKLKRHSLRKWF